MEERVCFAKAPKKEDCNKRINQCGAFGTCAHCQTASSLHRRQIQNSGRQRQIDQDQAEEQHRIEQNYGDRGDLSGHVPRKGTPHARDPTPSGFVRAGGGGQRYERAVGGQAVLKEFSGSRGAPAPRAETCLGAPNDHGVFDAPDNESLRQPRRTHFPNGTTLVTSHSFR